MVLNDPSGNNTVFDGAGSIITNAPATKVINVGGKKNAPPNSLLKMEANGDIILDGKKKITLRVGNNSLILDTNGVYVLSHEGDVICNAGKIFSITSPKNHISGETKIDGGDVFIN